MTTTVDAVTVRALMSGRLRLDKTALVYTVQSGTSVSGDVPTANPIVVSPRAYVQENATPYDSLPAKLMLSGGLVFRNTTLYVGNTYYIVVSAFLADLIHTSSIRTRLWYTSFSPTETVTNSYFFFSYPGNTVFEV